MADLVKIDRGSATPLHPMPAPCVLVMAGASIPALLRDVTGAGAEAETPARPAIGTRITLRHPRGGTMAAEIDAHTRSGVRLTFARDEQALGFALAVLVGALEAIG